MGAAQALGLHLEEPLLGELISAALGRTELLKSADAAALDALAAQSRVRRLRKGERLFAALDPGEEVYVITRGAAAVLMEPRLGAPSQVARLGPGDLLGEMAILGIGLRNATVVAEDELDVVEIPPAAFKQLLETRPQVAAALGRRLVDTLAAIDAELELLLSTPPQQGESPSPRQIARELVARVLASSAVLAATAFAATVAASRGLIALAFAQAWSPELVVRSSYMGGFTLLAAASISSILSYDTRWRQASAVLLGVALGLVTNTLGVILSFDIFYRDIHTPDPAHPLDVAALYARTQGIAIAAAVVAAAFHVAQLRSVYARWVMAVVRRRR